MLRSNLRWWSLWSDFPFPVCHLIISPWMYSSLLFLFFNSSDGFFFKQNLCPSFLQLFRNSAPLLHLSLSLVPYQYFISALFPFICLAFITLSPCFVGMFFFIYNSCLQMCSLTWNRRTVLSSVCVLCCMMRSVLNTHEYPQHALTHPWCKHSLIQTC